MKDFTSNHWTDAATGASSGGSTYGPGFAVSWQNGPLGRDENRIQPNGAFVETVIKVAIDRLEYYQKSKFASTYNAEALAHLNEAVKRLNARTEDRENRKVEGTHVQ